MEKLIVLTLLAFGGLGNSATANDSPVTNILDLQRAVLERRINVPFDLKARVLQPFTDKEITNISNFEDETGGIAIKDMVSESGQGPLAGNIVRLRGKTELMAGLYVYPLAREMTLLEVGIPPIPTPIGAADIHSSQYENRLVEIEGFVSDISIDEIDLKWRFISLRCPAGIVYAALPRNALAEASTDKLIDAYVRIRGICTKNSPQNSSRSYLDHFLCANSPKALQVIHLPPSDPFDSPPAVGPYASDILTSSIGTGRRRLTGRVLANWHGNKMLLRTGDGESAQAIVTGRFLPNPGEAVDVVGFPETDFYRLTLNRALWRPTDIRIADTNLIAIDTSVSKILANDAGKGRINISANGHLVRIVGKIRTLPSPDRGGWQIHLQDGEHIIPVYGQHKTFFARALVDGVCEITGICLLESENWRQQAPFPHITGMALVLRSADDIRILASPPFWTPGRLLFVIGTLLLVLCAILAWNLTLRILVERRSRELFRQQIDSATSKLRVIERTQLAVELHDSLSQNLAGVAMELEAAKQFPQGAAQELLRHLAIAWNTLKSCRNELRNCLWDLRNDALEERDMESAVQTALQPHIGDVRLAVRFSVPRLNLTDNTAHAILRIIRELAMNAIRHGKATSLRIAGSIEDHKLLFSVADNGCGFDPASAPGVRDGHFGLTGIRERIRHMNGSIRINSSTEHGTKVSISINLPKENA